MTEGVEAMLARQLARWFPTLREARTDADLLMAVSLAFGSPYGGTFDDLGYLEYRGSYRGSETVRKPEVRFSADSGTTWTTYKGRDLAVLVRRIMGTEPQPDLFASSVAA